MTEGLFNDGIRGQGEKTLVASEFVGGRIRWARRMAVLPAAATVCATPRRAPVHLLPRLPASSLSISFEVDASATVTYRAARTP